MPPVDDLSNVALRDILINMMKFNPNERPRLNSLGQLLREAVEDDDDDFEDVSDEDD